MIKFVVSILYTALSLPIYVGWAQGRAEKQIDKMQRAVFNTPGAESPLPPAVFLGAVGLFTSHIVVGQKILGLHRWQTILSFLLGIIAGLGIVYGKGSPYDRS